MAFKSKRQMRGRKDAKPVPKGSLKDDESEGADALPERFRGGKKGIRKGRRK